jgi:hypothetical protein
MTNILREAKFTPYRNYSSKDRKSSDDDEDSNRDDSQENNINVYIERITEDIDPRSSRRMSSNIPKFKEGINLSTWLHMVNHDFELNLR